MRIPGPMRRLALATGRRLPPGVVRAINLARGIDAPRPVELPPGHRVVVVAPHPDDELVGAGGTIAKHVAAGHPVRVVMATSGEASASFVGLGPDAARAQREDEARAALAEVGVGADQVVFLRLAEKDLSSRGSPSPPGGVSWPATTGAAATTGALTEALAAFGPDLVYSPSPADGHSVHAAVAGMVATAVRSLTSVTHVALYEVMTPVYPTVVVDVTDHIEAKLAGLGHYASALASFDIVHAARGLAAYRSVHAQHGRGYAEAFTLLRPSELADLVRQVADPPSA
ncbi:MAG: PIG-L deacetylase family protein [Acidimicrobiales bacterium]